MEDRRKLVACLELCGKSDHEITRLLDGADRKGELSDDPFVPQRIQDYMDKAKVSFFLISTVQTFANIFFLLSICILRFIISNYIHYLLHSTTQVDLHLYDVRLKVQDWKSWP